jgi:hypothetical protein
VTDKKTGRGDVVADVTMDRAAVRASRDWIFARASRAVLHIDRVAISHRPARQVLLGPARGSLAISPREHESLRHRVITLKTAMAVYRKQAPRFLNE